MKLLRQQIDAKADKKKVVDELNLFCGCVVMCATH